jgi:hypothetical protein
MSENAISNKYTFNLNKVCAHCDDPIPDCFVIRECPICKFEKTEPTEDDNDACAGDNLRDLELRD